MPRPATATRPRPRPDAQRSCVLERQPMTNARASILVVEDDEAMRDLLAEELGDAGFAVDSAGGAASGLELARVQRFDLVITDLRMPEMDGFDLIRGVTS